MEQGGLGADGRRRAADDARALEEVAYRATRGQCATAFAQEVGPVSLRAREVAADAHKVNALQLHQFAANLIHCAVSIGHQQHLRIGV